MELKSPLTSVLYRLDIERLPRLPRLVLPNEIDQILGWVDQFGVLLSNLGVNVLRFLMRNHPSVNTDPRRPPNSFLSTGRREKGDKL